MLVLLALPLSWACGARDALLVGATFDQPGGAGGQGSGAGGEGGVGGTGAGGSGVGGVEQMALGAYHSCARTFTGAVYCWGANYDGQIGTPDTPMNTVTPVEVPLERPARLLAAGINHNCAALDDGRVVCWGRNDAGQSGQPGPDDVVKPAAVALDTFEASVEALGLGEDISCAVLARTSDPRELWCWGAPTVGLAQDGASPTLVDVGVTSLGVGAHHACWSREDGSVVCSGDNSFQQCGRPGGPCDHETLGGLPPGFAATQVGSGHGNHTCAISDGFSLWCWGYNQFGQIGALMAPEYAPPLEVNFHPNFPITSLGLGYFHSCVLTEQSGTVTCWGDNSDGQIGIGSDAGIVTTPTNLPTLSGIVAVGSGTLHACAYRSPTEVFCWGQNGDGQLGDGTFDSKSTPVQISLP